MPVFAKPITYTIKTYQVKLWLANASNKCAMNTNANDTDAKATEDFKTSSVATEKTTCKNCDGQCGETCQYKEAYLKAIKAINPDPPKFSTYSVKNAVGITIKVNRKGDRVWPGESAREIESKLEDEPFGVASRWTAEEARRKKVVAEGLKKDGEEGEWVVV